MCYSQILCFKKVDILLKRDGIVSQSRIRRTSPKKRGEKFWALSITTFSGEKGEG